MGYLGVVIFGVGALAAAVSLAFPPRLEISPKGVSWVTPRKRFDFGWQEFSAFRIFSTRGRSLGVGYELAPDHAKRSDIARALGGVDGWFAGISEKPADELLSILNQAKAKWG
jgi:hypothetical protein